MVLFLLKYIFYNFIAKSETLEHIYDNFSKSFDSYKVRMNIY